MVRPNRHRKLGSVVSVLYCMAFSTKIGKVGVAVAMAAAVDVAVPMAVAVAMSAATVGELVGCVLSFASSCVMGREKHEKYHH